MDLSTTASIYGHYDLSDLSEQWRLLRSLDARNKKSRTSEVFQSPGSVHGLVEPEVEAAGIEPASVARRF